MDNFKQESLLYVLEQAVKEIDYLQKLLHATLPSAEGTKELLNGAIWMLKEKK